MSETATPKVSTIIIKTSFNCNLRCSYCYEGNKVSNKKINIETTKKILSEVAFYNPPNWQTHIIWHGGEPLLMGLDYYREAVEFQKSLAPNIRFRNSIQTNGILLSNEFIDFFSENNFHIGLSLDGPAIIHDSQRFSINGKNSFVHVFETIGRIQQRTGETKKLGALAVFTRTTLENLDEFYDFFKENNLGVQINPLIRKGSAESSLPTDMFVTPREYGRALIYLFDKWVSESNYSISIQPFENILKSFVTGKPQNCSFSKNCFSDYISFDPDGNIVPCGRWDKEDFCYGNIHQHTLQQALSSRDYEYYQTERTKVSRLCADCVHYEICNGGCSFSGYIKNRDLSEPDYYCESYKMLFSHMKDIVASNILARARSISKDKEINIL